MVGGVVVLAEVSSISVPLPESEILGGQEAEEGYNGLHGRYPSSSSTSLLTDSGAPSTILFCFLLPAPGRPPGTRAGR